MFQRLFAAGAFGSALALALLAWPTRVPASATAIDLRKPAPDFNLSDSKGTPVKLSDLLCRAELQAKQLLGPRVPPRTVLHQFPTIPTFLATDDKCHWPTLLCDSDRFAIR